MPYTESYLDIAKQSVSTAWCQVHEHEWNLKYIVMYVPRILTKAWKG